MPIGMTDMEYGDMSDSLMIKPGKYKEAILRTRSLQLRLIETDAGFG
jgi:hypothetical protein